MAIIKTDGNYMGLPMNIARGNPIPLDTTEIWYDFAELENYAKSGSTAYVGQIVQYVDTDAGTATAYIIANLAGELVEVGSATVGDNKTIELSEDGVLRLVGTGGETPVEVGAQLVMGDNGVVAWRKPDTTTIDGLSSAVTTLQTSVASQNERLTTAENDIDAIQSTLDGLGNIFNFAGSLTEEQWLALAGSTAGYDAGDVILVGGTVEYVCVEIEGVKRWEKFGDPSGVSALEGKVETLEGWKTTASGQITTLETKVATAETNISNLTNKDVELANDIAKKASSEDLAAAVARISTNEQAITDIKKKDAEQDTAIAEKASLAYVDNKVSDINTAIGKKADQTALDAVIEVMATDSELAEGLGKKVDTTTYEAKITELTTTIAGNTSAITDVKKTADSNKSAIESINTALGNKAESSVVSAIDTRLQKAESTITQHSGNISTLSGSVTSLQENKADKTAVTALDTRVAANEEAIATHATDYSALKGRVDGHDTSIAEAKAQADKGVSDAAVAASAAATAQNAADAAKAKAEQVLGAEGDEAAANTVFGAKAAAAAAQSAADAAQDEVDALENTVANLKQSLETADAGLDDRIDKIEAVIGGVQGAMHFVGVSITDPSSGVVTIEGKDDYVPADGDVVIYKDAEGNSIEYIYSASVWVELGDVSAEAKRIEALETWKTGTVTPALDKIPDIESDIAALETAKASLEARIKAAEDKNASQDTSISGLDTRLTTAEETIAKNAADIRSELAAKAAELQGDITAEATARAKAVSNLQGQIDTINSQLTWTRMGS